MSEQKTALELVDEILNQTVADSFQITRCAMEGIKEAIIDDQGKACARYAKQWNETAQAELKFRNLEESAIVMRPISELPDKVPDGCVLVCVNDDVITGTWYHALDMSTMRNHASNFYILPLPKPERKLKACPWCGAMPVKLTNYWNIKHTDACPIQSASVIMFEKCDTWGWE